MKIVRPSGCSAAQHRGTRRTLEYSNSRRLYSFRNAASPKWFDITRSIHNAMPVYQGDPTVSIEPWPPSVRGAPVNVVLRGLAV